MKKVWGFAGLAFLLWFVMFSPWTKGHFNFWIMMSLSAGGLGLAGLYFQRQSLKQLFKFKWQYLILGVFFSVLLYFIFYIGNIVSELLLPFAREQVSGIYSLKAGIDKFKVAILLLFLIGPGEEIFWRGYVQQRVSRRYNRLNGLIIATAIYTLVHVWSLNFMLIAAAAVCGLFWGLMFYSFRNLWICVISHALWDVMIFLIWPIS